MDTLAHIPLGTVVYLRSSAHKDVSEHTVKGVIFDGTGLRYTLDNQYTYSVNRVFTDPVEAFKG